MRAATLARVSTERQQTIDSQLAALRAWASARAIPSPGSTFFATKAPTRRSRFAALTPAPAHRRVAAAKSPPVSTSGRPKLVITPSCLVMT